MPVPAGGMSINRSINENSSLLMAGGNKDLKRMFNTEELRKFESPENKMKELQARLCESEKDRQRLRN
jgi:hypothetical protein